MPPVKNERILDAANASQAQAAEADSQVFKSGFRTQGAKFLEYIPMPGMGRPRHHWAHVLDVASQIAAQILEILPVETFRRIALPVMIIESDKGAVFGIQ